MRIQFMSDLHLEFGDFQIRNFNDADVLVLAGDICVAHTLNVPDVSSLKYQSDIFHNFFKNAVKEFDHVLYIPGNHEFYHSEYHKALKVIQTLCNEYGIYFMDGASLEIGGVNFVGATLWSDINPVDEGIAAYNMNDYKTVKLNVKGSYRKFLPRDTKNFHNRDVHRIKDLINEGTNNKTVVFTHHAPSLRSLDPRYSDYNSCYATDLEYLMDDRVKVWIHGHMHMSHDYLIGDTRVLCNPRGYYGHEVNPDFDPYKVIEV